jgi:predicted transcriptional regulator
VAVSAVDLIDPAKLKAEIRALGFTRRQFAAYARFDISELDRVLAGQPFAPEMLHRIARAIADARRGQP